MSASYPQITLHHCFKHLQTQGLADTLILTRNQRQARYLKQQWLTAQSERVSLVAAPNIQAIDLWISKQWQHYAKRPIASQETTFCFMLDTIMQIDAKPHSTPLASTHLALAALSLLAQYGCTWQALASYQTDEQIAWFLQYCKAFDQASQDLKATHAFENERLLTDMMRQPLIHPLPASIYLFGFIRFTPQLDALLAAMASHATLTCIKEPARTQHYQCQAFETPIDEYKAMAAWALAKQQAHPGASITCIVPNLIQEKATIQASFHQVDKHHADVVNYSGGVPLSTTPVVALALQLLNLNPKRVHWQALSTLIRSPFWGTDHAMADKDLLDAILRQADHPTLTYKQLFHLFEQMPLTENCQALIDALKNWHHHQRTKPKGLRSYQAWMQYFITLWQSIAWPSQTALDSLSYQQWQQFMELWLRFAACDHDLPPCNHQTARNHLHALCAQHLFAPESHFRPIQVLGALEAHGCQSDFVWMCQLDDQHWPPRGHANPFLPLSFQREHHMPYACHETQRAYHDALTDDLWHSGKEVILSYSQWLGAEQQAPCAALLQSPIHIMPQQCLPTSSAQNDTRFFSTSTDCYGPALTRNARMPGGSYGLETQAQCPFHYFAQYRLAADSLATPEQGIHAADRGTLVHAALATIWETLQSSQQLHALREDSEDQLIDDAITQALALVSVEPIEQEVEKTRLTLLLKQWLAVEKERPPFKVIATEKSVSWHAANISCALRIDRIDQLADQTAMVIDYKTSKQARIDGWFDERLTSPQIPLSVLTQTQPTFAATLALLRRGNHRFMGIARYDTDIKGIRALDSDDDHPPGAWPALVEQWSEQITVLMHGIQQGYAAVTPDPNTQPCRYCDFALLCRIHHADT